MGHAAPISLGAGCLRLVPRRPGFRLGLFGGGPSAACSAEATGWWLPALAHQRPPRTPGRPWSLTLPVRAVLVLVHLRTNLTTRALAPLFHAANPPWTASFITWPPVLARALHPDPAGHTALLIIDGTLIPVRDRSVTAISKNYRRSVNTQIIICAHCRRVVVIGRCWLGNRNDVLVARHTVAQPLDGRVVLGDGGYRGITRITAPRDRANSPANTRSLIARRGRRRRPGNTSADALREVRIFNITIT